MEPTRHEFMHMEPWGFKAAFYALTALSLAVMAAQFLQRARVWQQGKPVWWRSDGLAQVSAYILGQRKVQSSRPKGGAPMHLMIFYGFLSLLLATTLLGIATYSPVIGLPNFHRGVYYLVYETTFDVLGLFFVAGVVWAFFRRWRYDRTFGQPQPDPETGKPETTPNPLTSDWRDYATLGILFMLGVTGYVLEAARISNSPQEWDWASPVGHLLAQAVPNLSNGAYIGIWWFHAAWVWAFFAFLPQMRIRHVVTATLTAAGAPSKPMGELVPVTMEEVEETGQIGVAVAKDYSRWHLLSLDACMSCGRCTEVCPAYNVGKVLNPKQVVQDIRDAAVTGDPVALKVTEEALWQCTTCNACVEACPVLIKHVDMIVDARRNLVAEGKLSGTPSVMLRQVGSTGNAWGAPAANREDWMKGLDVPLCRDGGSFDYLFWVGCAGATDPGAVKTTQAVAKLLKKAGVKFACLGREEACTGDPARRTGDEFLFQEQAGKNVHVFEKYGVKRVVTACPHCFNTLKNEYHQLGGRLEVFHHTQLLRDLIDEGRLNPARPKAGEVAFHDPCYLARVNQESDAPRALVGERTSFNTDAPGLAHDLLKEPDENKVLAEPVQHAHKTLCCGAGGGRMWFEEEPGKRPSERRVRQLLETGAKQIAVACPFCRIMLDASIKQVAGDDVSLVDMAELLQGANEPGRE
ncbi:MAG: (Fe-S)-binding protein [Fimbriimonadaceae bacterium]|nr:(Fe-S)-binding protein [Fimbriimonadaceae bacterium]QYK55780.1 MAG: (Fe-S)-binding protein [Fimbriimonadaceae bacterium]